MCFAYPSPSCSSASNPILVINFSLKVTWGNVSTTVCKMVEQFGVFHCSKIKFEMGKDDSLKFLFLILTTIFHLFFLFYLWSKLYKNLILSSFLVCGYDLYFTEIGIFLYYRNLSLYFPIDTGSILSADFEENTLNW